MADPKNSGQFGNRSDTKKQAAKGGKASGASGAASDKDAQRRGGKNSHKNR